MERPALALRGSAVRQDGRSASLTAPNGQAQQGLLGAALADASTSAAALALNEAHGTGTKLGDPIEAGSLAASVLAALEAPLGVSGVKANIGHAEPAAGLTGLLKLAVGLPRGEAAPNAQLRALNPHVRSAERGKPAVMSCQLARGGMASDAPASQSGGVSSFGYSGTIAHAVLAFGSGGGGEALAFGRAADSSIPALAFGSRGAEAAGGGVLATCSRREAERSTFERRSMLPLAYRRHAFPWRELASSVDVERTSMYALSWAQAPAAAAGPSRTCLFLTTPRVPDDARPASHPWHAVAVLLQAGGSAAPSLRGTHVALALAHIEKDARCTPCDLHPLSQRVRIGPKIGHVLAEARQRAFWEARESRHCTQVWSRGEHGAEPSHEGVIEEE